MKSICDFLLKNNIKIAIAESFTGGGLASRFVSVPGISEVFLASIVAYTDTMKEQLLGVDGDILSCFGAVSAECASAMALGVIEKTGADIAVATTGFAGPAADSDVLPVGTFFIAVSDNEQTVVRRFFHLGSRSEVTACGINEAVQLLSDFLLKKHQI